MNVMDVPVGRSYTVVKSHDASHIHGTDGLGNASKYLPRVRIPKIPQSSEDLLEKLTKKYPEVQILTIGPLTNIAQLIRKDIHPTRIISMG